MGRIDLLRLRKSAGMSQRELAELLQVRPSFLSAIENGRSRMPEEKLEKLKEIFMLDDLDDYMREEKDEVTVPPHTHAELPHTHVMAQGDSLTQLLRHIHDLAHREDKAGFEHEQGMASKLEYLEKRNDRLSERVDNLRDEVDSLRVENLRLKELLVKNGIQY